MARSSISLPSNVEPPTSPANPLSIVVASAFPENSLTNSVTIEQSPASTPASITITPTATVTASATPTSSSTPTSSASSAVSPTATGSATPPAVTPTSASTPSTPTAELENPKKLLRPATAERQPDFYTAVAESSSEFGAASKAIEDGYRQHSASAVHRVSIAAEKHEAQQQQKLTTILKKQESSKTMTKPVKAPAPALVVKKAATIDLSTPMYVDRWGDVHNGERKEELSWAQQRKLVKKATSREAKWLTMAGKWREVSTKNKSQLRRRIRKGIPDSLRPLVWPHLCCSAVEKAKPENRQLYQSLLSQEIAPADDEQIRKDLPRAFQTHVMFKSPEAGSRDVVCSGQAALYNILKAYSIRHRSVGYVQGMTGLAGLCLMYLPEEDAYWMLEVLLSGTGETEGLSRLYEKGMPLAFEYLAIYESLLIKRLPVLAAHLNSLGVLPTSYAFRWLTTRFALFPKGLMIRIFDIFLHEGMKIIYRVCLYLMTRFSKDLLKLDYEGVSTFLESIKTHPGMYDEDEVIRGALKIKLKAKMLAEMSRVYRADRKSVV